MVLYEPVGLAGRVTPRTAWGREEALNNWLLEQGPLARFGQLVGMRIEPMVREAKVTGGRADFLCIDEAVGTVVVIESQLGIADLDHVGRLLGYALEYDAGAAVLVAGKVPDLIAEFGARSQGQIKVGFKLFIVQVGAFRTAAGAYVATLDLVKPKVNRTPVKRLLSANQMIVGAHGSSIPTSAWRKLHARLCVNLIGASKEDSMPKVIQGLLVNGKLCLVELWPDVPTPATLAATMAVVIAERVDTLVIMTWQLRAAVRNQLATLVGCLASSIRVELVEVQRGPTNELSFLVRDVAAVIAHSQTQQRKRVRLEFWEQVGSIVARASGTKMRKRRALGIGSHSLVYGLGKKGVRLAALYMVRLRNFCVEVRIHNANPTIARNQYRQLREFRPTLECALGLTFELQWLGARARQNEQILRLVWREQVDAKNPYTSTMIGTQFAQAVLKVERELKSWTGQLESFCW